LLKSLEEGGNHCPTNHSGLPKVVPTIYCGVMMAKMRQADHASMQQFLGPKSIIKKHCIPVLILSLRSESHFEIWFAHKMFFGVHCEILVGRIPKIVSRKITLSRSKVMSSSIQSHKTGEKAFFFEVDVHMVL